MAFDIQLEELEAARAARRVLKRSRSYRGFERMPKFGKELHLRKPQDFERVYQARVYAADDVLVVNGDANGLAHARLGLSVSKKVGAATVRNRWKRLIREAFRLSQEQLPPGIDLVVRPQKDAQPDFAAISRSLPALAARIARRLKGRATGPEK